MALNFNQFAAEGNEFIKTYASELLLGDDVAKAGRILSSILHGLREIISVEESLQLISQFPMFLKAVYVNGWSSHKKKRRIKNMHGFVDMVWEFDGTISTNDFKSYDLAEKYIEATFIMLRKYISSGEIEDIRSELPKDLKSMLYHKVMF